MHSIDNLQNANWTHMIFEIKFLSKVIPKSLTRTDYFLLLRHEQINESASLPKPSASSLAIRRSWGMQSKSLERSSQTSPTILFESSCLFHASVQRIWICLSLHSFVSTLSKICRNSLACLINWSNVDDSIISEKVSKH